ncbi:MAG: hypothetical protein Q9216_007188 [Gyalolechia sp. 2 TL-2023]
MKISTLKRKTSEFSDQEAPEQANPFLHWRVMVIESLIEYNNAVIEGHKEAMACSSAKQIQTLEKTIGENTHANRLLEKEMAIILKQGRLLQEDLQDSPRGRVEDAYTTALHTKMRSSSEDGHKQAKKAPKRRSRSDFKDNLTVYLTPTDSQHPDELFCNAMGEFVPQMYMKTTPIIPFTFQSRELDYLFGTETSALESERNGLFLVRTVAQQFDNLKITIVPDSSLDIYPIEWKFVVLDPTLLDKTCFVSFVDPPRLTRFRDLDGRRLRFRNDNRPARRYLYFKHAMAVMHARIQKFPGSEEKIPSGTMWATPDKRDGYLRRSVLSTIARRIGDDDILPTDLLLNGTFTDTQPESGLAVRDTLASFKVGDVVERMVVRGGV